MSFNNLEIACDSYTVKYLSVLFIIAYCKEFLFSVMLCYAPQFAEWDSEVNMCFMIDICITGAMANYPNGLTGSTPLHEAVECLRSSQYKLFKEILFSLLNHHGPVGLLNIESASSYDTPLARALVHNKDHMMILLIQYGADVSLLQQHTPVVSETYLQKRPNRWIIAQLMVFAGLDLWKHTPTIKMDINYPDDSPASWIATLKCNPMSLSALCRLKFRRLFGENLHKAVYRSGLPPLLRKFILLEDIVNADDFLCPST